MINLMKPKINKTSEYIEIIGHYDSEILCAKLTLLADLYAIEHREGYARFKLEDEDKLRLIDDRLEFAGEATPGDMPSEVLSDLTGTKWVFNDNLTIRSETEYAINFNANNHLFVLLVKGYGNDYGDGLTYGDGTEYISVYHKEYSTYLWLTEYKTIEITGGSDVTNSDLIAWLQSNASQIIEPTNPTLTLSGDLSSYLTVKVNNVTVSSGYELSHGDKVELFLDDNYPDYEILINGKEITDSEITVVNEGISIEVNEYSPYDAVLGNNDWATIQMASKNHNFPSSWQVGDTKLFIYNGAYYVARLTDRTGKYRRVSDNSIAYLKFEATELLPDSEIYSSTGNNKPLQSTLLVSMNSGSIYNNIDSTLKSVVEAVKVEVSEGYNSSTLVNFEGKFFLQREHDLFSTRSRSFQTEWDAINAQDEYYQIHNTSNDRAKKKQSESSSSAYYLISPSCNIGSQECVVTGSGGIQELSVYGTPCGVAFCFAL